MMATVAGVIHALQLDGTGGASALPPEQITSSSHTESRWLHLDLNELQPEQLQNELGLSPTTVDMLCAEDTRPRCVQAQEGVLLNLRGININPGAEPDDMVSLRILCQSHRLISVRKRRIYSVLDVTTQLHAGNGPKHIDELLASLTKHLTHRMRDLIDQLEDQTDLAEDQLFEKGDLSVSERIYPLRTQLIHFRRYFAPQKDAILALISLKPDWLSEDSRFGLRERADATQRLIEQIDTLKERLSFIKAEVEGQLAAKSEKRIYLLTIFAGIFVPMGFFTGLLGINVGGIPLADNEWGFTLVCGLILVTAAIQVAIFYIKRWF
ncbi:zinc transporter ZntB [Corallincola luteus]|uniref:Zinc transporter ZntB n=1 Tax=Corallincola luteus TaxID=1775177 RepID=A0ABY2AGP3_9GAMM|nr:zinc transporter ZntB [Corallincola luteus]TCI01282.1 zinc transporter ZntB [Corallincola luteus]